MGLTWVLSAPDGPHVGPMNLVFRVETQRPFWIDIHCHLGLCWDMNLGTHHGNRWRCNGTWWQPCNVSHFNIAGIRISICLLVAEMPRRLLTYHHILCLYSNIQPVADQRKSATLPKHIHLVMTWYAKTSTYILYVLGQLKLIVFWGMD